MLEPAIIVTKSESDPDSIPVSPSIPDLGFQYEPLASPTRSIRLLQIVAMDTAKDNIQCELLQFTFESAPPYEALSYMWGDDALVQSISTHGKEIKVTQNLWDALSFLRNRAQGLYYWIDALSINQRDTAERNQQLRLMPHIYMRAQCVLVWLGYKYTGLFGGRRQDLVLWDGNQNAEQGCNEGAAGLLVKEILETMYFDAYWDRLWIIQEMGMANQIRVGFGEIEISWQTFKDKFVSYAVEKPEIDPGKLQKLRKSSCHVNHTLKQLLETHQHALCKDPRDKIYGLVGLAYDARGFPMDYGKLLPDVWKDTMTFASIKDKFSDQTTVSFAKLVKRLLGITKQSDMIKAAATQPAEGDPAMPWKITQPSCTFPLAARILGFIFYVGPSVEQIKADPDTVDEWREHTQLNFAEEDGRIFCESDQLLRKVLSGSIADLAMTPFPDPKPVPQTQNYACLDSVRIIYQLSREFRDKAFEDMRSFTPLALAEPDPSQTVLYHMRSASTEQPFWTVGLATGAAQAGDLICYIEQADLTVIARISPNMKLKKSRTTASSIRILGTATGIQRRCMECTPTSPAPSASAHHQINIDVDVDTLYRLT